MSRGTAAADGSGAVAGPDLPNAFLISAQEEFQLVDPTSVRLVGSAVELLGESPAVRAKRPRKPPAEPDISHSCERVAELRVRLAERRRWLQDRAEAQGLALLAAGLHPLASGRPTRSAPTRRNPVLSTGTANLAPAAVPCRLRLRVTVPSREMVVHAMAGALPYVPPLLALAGNSPFYLAQDTGYNSYSTVLADASPRGGPPPPVQSCAEFDEICRILRQADAASGKRRGSASARRPWREPDWDIRPVDTEPRIEFTFLDVSPWLDHVALLGACVRALTCMFADRPPQQPTALQMQVLRENRWRAARFGMEARFVRTDGGTRVAAGAGTTSAASQWTAADALRSLVDRLGPVAERLGDGETLANLELHLQRGSPAAAMRSAFARHASLEHAVQWLAAETAAAAAAPTG
jgi:carboxylate-amine ligase